MNHLDANLYVRPNGIRVEDRYVRAPEPQSDEVAIPNSVQLIDADRYQIGKNFNICSVRISDLVTSDFIFPQSERENVNTEYISSIFKTASLSTIPIGEFLSYIETRLELNHNIRLRGNNFTSNPALYVRAGDRVFLPIAPIITLYTTMVYRNGKFSTYNIPLHALIDCYNTRFAFAEAVLCAIFRDAVAQGKVYKFSEGLHANLVTALRTLRKATEDNAQELTR